MTVTATPAADDDDEDASSSNDTGMPFIFLVAFFHSGSTNDFFNTNRLLYDD
jgi:hypothetical protein